MFTDIPINGYPVKAVVIWLALAGIATTLFFRFINIRGFALALRTVKGFYSCNNDNWR